MSLSQVQICNLALGHISQRPIQDINEGTPQANACSSVWDACVQECLRGQDWPFATVSEALAVIPGYSQYGWTYAYAYPSNCMACWRVYNEQTIDKQTGEMFRKVFARTLNQLVILTNCENAYAEFTYKISDTNLFDANFATVLAYRIAADIAMPLNADPQQATAMIQIFNGMMSDAQRMAKYENYQAEGPTSSSFEDSRS